MERKNMVLLGVIAVATLLVAVVGATFAYFTATVEDKRTDGDSNGKTTITAGSVASKTVIGNVSNGAGKFEATGVYPNHKEVAGLSVTVTNGEKEENTNTNVSIVYNVTQNDFANEEIEVSVYKSDEDLEVRNYFNCTHTANPQAEENAVQYTETCAHDISELESTLQATKLTQTPIKLNKGPQSKLVLANDTIAATGAKGTNTAYYYVVVEFKDTGKSQNDSMNAVLNGTISVEAA